MPRSVVELGGDIWHIKTRVGLMPRVPDTPGLRRPGRRIIACQIDYALDDEEVIVRSRA